MPLKLQKQLNNSQEKRWMATKSLFRLQSECCSLIDIASSRSQKSDAMTIKENSLDLNSWRRTDKCNKIRWWRNGKLRPKKISEQDWNKTVSKARHFKTSLEVTFILLWAVRRKCKIVSCIEGIINKTQVDGVNILNGEQWLRPRCLSTNFILL